MIVQPGDTLPSALINLGEQLRSRQEFARAETLNLAALRFDSTLGTALGNVVELQLDQGKVKEAAAGVTRLSRVSPAYAAGRRFFVAWAAGDERAYRAITDSLFRVGGPTRIRSGVPMSRSGALHDRRVRGVA